MTPETSNSRELSYQCPYCSVAGCVVVPTYPGPGGNESLFVSLSVRCEHCEGRFSIGYIPSEEAAPALEDKAQKWQTQVLFLLDDLLNDCPQLNAIFAARVREAFDTAPSLRKSRVFT